MIFFRLFQAIQIYIEFLQRNSYMDPTSNIENLREFILRTMRIDRKKLQRITIKKKIELSLKLKILIFMIR